MPANRNALIRYKTIDKCLQNHYRKWTLEDLIDACSDALYEYEGIDKGVSKRTIQADIQLMRSDKLGYNAPIIVVDKKYYIYEDKEYSITNIPVTDQDLEKLNETVEFLKQFKGFSHFKELDSMVQKLEDHVYSQKTNQEPVIDFEKNENLKGLEYLDALYQNIIQQKAIHITYKSFKARQSNSFDFHPYLLKEFRNRWFIIGSKNKADSLLNLALDRIISIDKSDTKYLYNTDFKASDYFKHTIGVSVSPNIPPEKIELFVTNRHAPYVLTKPLHSSQKVIEKDHYGITISIDVHLNFELEKEILGFGDGIKVIAPERLKRIIKERLAGGLDLYNTEINESGLGTSNKRLIHKGFSTINYVYTKREIKRIKIELNKNIKNTKEQNYSTENILNDIPSLKSMLYNKNLQRIINSINPNSELTKAIYIDRPQQYDNQGIWQQNFNKEQFQSEEKLKNSFTIKIHLDDINEKNGALKLVPGSHNKILSDSEIKTISSNSIPFVCEVPAGGFLLIKPLLLHMNPITTSQKKRRIIQLEFNSKNLTNNMEDKLV